MTVPTCLSASAKPSMRPPQNFMGPSAVAAGTGTTRKWAQAGSAAAAAETSSHLELQQGGAGGNWEGVSQGRR